MRDKTFVETPLYAVPAQGNDPMTRSLWEDVKSLAKGDMPYLRYRGKVIHAPNGGRGFQRWPSDKALDWAVAVYDQLGGTWGHSRNAKSKIPGGKAEGKSPKEFDSKQLLMGIEVELEHTGDRDLAREIAMDHLTEIPDYYTRLLRMETQANSESPADKSASTTTRESVPMISRIASRVFLASVADTPVNTFSFEILLRWFGAKGGLQTRDGLEPLEYTIPAAGRVKVEITGTTAIESLPPKLKVIDSDEMFQNDLKSFHSNVVPDDVTETRHASEFDVNDTRGEYFALLNARTGMVLVMHSPGLKRLVFGNKLPAKVTGTGFMVPISVFRATYHFVPTVHVESFPEILRAMLTHVEDGVRVSDSSDWYR